MGASKGNKNALKHGFYSKQFTPEETKRLAGAEPHGVESELELLRVCIDRLAKQLDFKPVYLTDKDENEIRDDHYLKQLNTLTLIAQALATLERTHYLTRGKGGAMEIALIQALEELRLEMKI